MIFKGNFPFFLPRNDEFQPEITADGAGFDICDTWVGSLEQTGNGYGHKCFQGFREEHQAWINYWANTKRDLKGRTKVNILNFWDFDAFLKINILVRKKLIIEKQNYRISWLIS